MAYRKVLTQQHRNMLVGLVNAHVNAQCALAAIQAIGLDNAHESVRTVLVKAASEALNALLMFVDGITEDPVPEGTPLTPGATDLSGNPVE